VGVPVADPTSEAGPGAIIQAGNRDATVHPDPDTLHLDRQARTHLAFGFGAYRCLGQQLAPHRVAGRECPA
jgi:cytochrome P450